MLAEWQQKYKEPIGRKGQFLEGTYTSEIWSLGLPKKTPWSTWNLWRTTKPFRVSPGLLSANYKPLNFYWMISCGVFQHQSHSYSQQCFHSLGTYIWCIYCFRIDSTLGTELAFTNMPPLSDHPRLEPAPVHCCQGTNSGNNFQDPGPFWTPKTQQQLAYTDCYTKRSSLQTGPWFSM